MIICNFIVTIMCVYMMSTLGRTAINNLFYYIYYQCLREEELINSGLGAVPNFVQ